MARAEFLFDFGSPNAYLAHKIIPQIEQRAGVKFEYVPVLLGGIFKLTGNQSPVVAFGGIRNKPEYERLEMLRFIRRHRLTEFQMNPHFPVNTLAIMRGAIAAGNEGVLAGYVDAVFRAMWEEGRKMDDSDVIGAALAESGLPADKILAATQTHEVKQALMSNTEAAVARGTFGIPTFFVGEEIFFGKNTLGEVEDEICRTQR